MAEEAVAAIGSTRVQTVAKAVLALEVCQYKSEVLCHHTRPEGYGGVEEGDGGERGMGGTVVEREGGREGRGGEGERGGREGRGGEGRG